MHVITCSHSCTPLLPGVAFYKISIDGKSRYIVKVGGTSHDAAYLAHRQGIVYARKLGYKNVIVRTTSPLVRNQLNRTWRARKPGTKRNMAACLAAAAGMNVIHA